MMKLDFEERTIVQQNVFDGNRSLLSQPVFNYSRSAAPACDVLSILEHVMDHGDPRVHSHDGSQSDLLSSFLSPCQIQCRDSRSWRLTAPWGLDFRMLGAGFVVVLDGACRLLPAGLSDDLTLAPNDLVIFTREARFALCDQADSRLVPVDRVLRQACSAAGAVMSFGGGGRACRLLSGELVARDDYTRQAFSLMPPLLFARGDAPEIATGMGPLLRLFVEELEQRRPGGELLAERVLQAMLVFALRIAPLTLPGSAEMLQTLGVPGLGMVIGAIHARPAHDWSVHELAELAGLSRSKFAVRFVEVLGRPPVDYLREVRMRLASRMLDETDCAIKEIASRVGYANEASFSKAFARSIGCAPGEYRRQNKR